MTAPLEHFNREPRVAYFSMEIALRSEIPTYSGGLGVLAGDTMRSAADLDLPMVGVTLVSRARSAQTARMTMRPTGRRCTRSWRRRCFRFTTTISTPGRR